MALTRTTTVRLLRLLLIFFIIAIIVIYAIWRSLNYARGPEIRIDTPRPGSTVASSTVEIRGQALRITSLSLNGSVIPVDQQGNFDEIIVVFPGMNRLTISANDQFGRQTAEELDIFGAAR